MKNTVYYLPGYGGLLATGLGAGLLARGLDVTGRQTVDEFKALPFQEQVDLVAQDLHAHFWRADARVVANSFGAYLFLHAQAQLPPFPGRVLLLSPIVGEFSNEDSQMNFIPPRAERLQALVQAGHYPRLARCEVHVGEQDWQSNPVNVAAFGAQLELAVTTVPQAGHMLGKSYVSALLDRWL
jgi:alpha-beta hydrolase superfamily lysophospholipase